MQLHISEKPTLTPSELWSNIGRGQTLLCLQFSCISSDLLEDLLKIPTCTFEDITHTAQENTWIYPAAEQISWRYSAAPLQTHCRAPPRVLSLQQAGYQCPEAAGVAPCELELQTSWCRSVIVVSFLYFTAYDMAGSWYIQVCDTDKHLLTTPIIIEAFTKLSDKYESCLA